MNLLAHPELLDRLAAAHALGTLRGGVQGIDDVVGCGGGSRERARSHTREAEGEEIGGGFAEVVVDGEGVAEIGRDAVGRGDGFFAIAAEGGEDIGDKGRAVVRDDAEGVASFIDEARIFEGEFDVIDLFSGAGGVERADGEDGSGKRVFLGEAGFGVGFRRFGFRCRCG